MSYYLILNAGSSSLKFSLYEMPFKTEIVNGNIEKIGEDISTITLKNYKRKETKTLVVKNHEEAIKLMLDSLIQNHFINYLEEITNIGHRILHGGEKYKDSVIIDDEVIEDIEDLTKFGPLHHPKELIGIKTLQKILPIAQQTAVFDTSFHQTIPKENYLYAIPYEYYEKEGIRKYGFHGTSHKYITETMQNKLQKQDINIISCHIGSGASICAIKNGLSYDTSMGLTPLDGLIMGTRSGSIDPSIVSYIANLKHISCEQVLSILNNDSGLKGLCQKNDMRDIHEMIDNGDELAKITYTMFVNSIVSYIAKYYIELNGQVDAIVFTAGAGENDDILRHDIMNRLTCLGIKENNESNIRIAKFRDQHEGIISNENSSIPIYVVPTNEELMILNDMALNSIRKKLKQNN